MRTGPPSGLHFAFRVLKFFFDTGVSLSWNKELPWSGAQKPYYLNCSCQRDGKGKAHGVNKLANPYASDWIDVGLFIDAFR